MSAQTNKGETLVLQGIEVVWFYLQYPIIAFDGFIILTQSIKCIPFVIP